MGTSVLNQPQGNMRFLAIALLVSLAVLCSGKPSPKPKFFLVETKDKVKRAKYEEDPGHDYLSKYQEGKDNYVKEEHDVYETTTTEKSYNDDDAIKKMKIQTPMITLDMYLREKIRTITPRKIDTQ